MKTTKSALAEKIENNQRSGSANYSEKLERLEIIASSKNIGILFYKTNGNKFSYSAHLIAYDSNLPLPVNCNGKNILKCIDMKMSESNINSTIDRMLEFIEGLR